MSFEKDLPDELQGEQIERPRHDDTSRDQVLEALGIAIGELRDEAVTARRESGIEAIWTAAEEAYLGIDDANRGEFKGAKWAKPINGDSPLTRERASDDNTKSTAYVRMTSRYVDMAAAKIAEIALPIDDKAFSFGPTPVPELVTQKDSKEPVVDPQTGQPLMLGPDPDVQGPQPAQTPLTQGDVAKDAMEQAQDAAEKAEKRIWDGMTESGYPGHMRVVIHDGARIGVGVLKGPFPGMQISRALQRTGNVAKLTIVHKSVPSYKWIDAWNLFPDPACGEDIHSGDHIFEHDSISPRTLRDLKKAKNSAGDLIYLGDQIDKVLEEGPGKQNVTDQNPNKKPNKKHFDIWYFTGTVKRSELLSTNAIGANLLPDELDEVHAVITLVNDTVIRATINPLESGNFPYRAMPWSRRAGHWAGVGVAEQIAMPQRMINAATRAMLNNAGNASGPQIIYDPLSLQPVGSRVITPNKFWEKTADAVTDDVSKLFVTVDIPIQFEPLMGIIQYALRLAEESSNIPLVSQGQVGPNDPQTFGQAELQNTNANALLRAIGLRLDDYITEPVVHDSYEMLLLDPNVPDDEKGDFKISAHGTMAMVERAIQEQTMMQAGQLTANPAFGIDPKKWFAEYWKQKHLDPRKIQYSEEEQAEMAKQPPPVPPQIEAAKINAKARMDVAQVMTQAGVEKSKIDTDRDVAYRESLNELARIRAASDAAKLAQERELEVFKENNSLRKEADTLKVKLAALTMELQTQKELSTQALAVDVDKHRNPSPVIAPKTEPAGRAEPGQAYAQ